MKIKDLFLLSFNNVKKNLPNVIVLSIICGLFLAALYLLDIVLPGTSFFITLLVVLPFFFACIMTYRSFKYKADLQGKNLFAYFLLYFKPPFFGCFRVVWSFLKMLIVELIVSLVAGSIICAIFYKAEPLFSAAINEMLELIQSGSLTQEALDSYLLTYEEILVKFGFFMNAIPLAASCVYFIYCVTMEAPSIYLRSSIAQSNPVLIKDTYRQTIKQNRGKFYKLFFGLNWPLLLLCLIGYGLGSLVSYAFFGFSINEAFSCSVCGALVMMTFYLPFYFSNNEIIYELFINDFKDVYKEIVDDIKTRLSVLSQVDDNPFMQDNSDGMKVGDSDVVDADVDVKDHDDENE